MLSPDDSAATQAMSQAMGLVYVTDDGVGIGRRKAGTGFSYRDSNGAALKEQATLQRIRALAIPPAWSEVWICPDANGHLQATGRDDKGRKQYLYHPGFREVRDSVKFAHLLEFGRTLSAIRARVAKDMALAGLPRRKVLATTVHLLETTLIRVGNDDYAKQNGSFGLTTLRRRHLQVAGNELRFRFKGKSGKIWRVQLRDRRVARILKACQDLPGQQLLQYQDDSGAIHDATSSDVNAYLKEITGAEITAKDFRTWAGTVLTTTALQEFSAFASIAEAQKNIRTAIKHVATHLGNTATICRKCYVHPDILEAYLDGTLPLGAGAVRAKARSSEVGLTPDEIAVLALLKSRLGKG
ncbi:MAG TPA: DNA topoisomerase IB [Devosia sp.]|nr:DNA topoisomerase IB [Devosia sp.]